MCTLQTISSLFCSVAVSVAVSMFASMFAYAFQEDLLVAAKYAWMCVCVFTYV